MQAISNKVAEVSRNCPANPKLTAPQRLGDAPTVVSAEYKHREDGSTMKALAWFGTNDVRLVDAPIPDITEPDDVILKVTGTTICGSDLHLCVKIRTHGTDS